MNPMLSILRIEDVIDDNQWCWIFRGRASMVNWDVLDYEGIYEDLMTCQECGDYFAWNIDGLYVDSWEKVVCQQCCENDQEPARGYDKEN